MRAIREWDTDSMKLDADDTDDTDFLIMSAFFCARLGHLHPLIPRLGACFAMPPDSLLTYFKQRRAIVLIFTYICRCLLPQRGVGTNEIRVIRIQFH